MAEWLTKTKVAQITDPEKKRKVQHALRQNGIQLLDQKADASPTLILIRQNI